MDERKPISDLERLSKIARQVRAGQLPEDDAIFAVAQIIASSPTARDMGQYDIESLALLFSGYFLHCRSVGFPGMKVTRPEFVAAPRVPR